LYEVDHGKWKINYKPKNAVPVVEWFKLQGRFKHILSPDNKEILQWHQQELDREWAELLRREEQSKTEKEQ